MHFPFGSAAGILASFVAVLGHFALVGQQGLGLPGAALATSAGNIAGAASLVWALQTSGKVVDDEQISVSQSQLFCVPGLITAAAELHLAQVRRRQVPVGNYGAPFAEILCNGALSKAGHFGWRS